MGKAWKPNLFVLGVPRGATTTLYQYFKRHPQIYQPFVKSPSFFGDWPDPQKPENFHNLQIYYDLYKDSKTERYRSDFTHLLHSKKAPKEIYEFNSESKFIIILRNPLDAMRSKWNLTRKMIGKIDFSQYLKTKYDGKMMLESVKYYTNLKRYMRYFKKENIHIIIYDDFKKDNKKEILRLCNFLNIKPIKPSLFKYNMQSEKRNEWIRILLNIFPSEIKFKIRMFLPYLVGESIRKRVLIWTNKPIEPESIPPQERKKLLKLLKDEIEKTGKIIGRDTSFWSK